MSYLTLEERKTIEIMNDSHHTQKEIAIAIGRSQQCISKEIRQYRYKGVYNAKYAQMCADKKRYRKQKYTKLTSQIKSEIEKYLKRGWSPLMIVNRKKALGISVKTVYRWIKEKKINIHKNDLPRKGKKSRKKYYKHVGRLGEEHNNIENRPKEANERLELGHWEGDTVVSSKNKYCIVTVVDRKSRFLLSKVIPNRKADTVAKAIIHLLRGQHVKSVTFDNGREFADYQKIENRFNITAYFAHPYASWERGTNENTNGLLRRYFPKKTDFKKVSQKCLDRVVYELNTKPRMVLDFLTSYEMYWNRSLNL